jgi:hypothetical protein
VLLAPHLLATSTPSQSPWMADVDGSYLADELVAALSGKAGKKETARDLVKAFGFHPAVDQLLYAPHVAFGASLFGMLEEPDPDRSGADRARNLLPMGRFVVEKLRDRLGARFSEAMLAHLSGKSLIDAAQASSDEDLAYFWKQWIAPHRPVAYRIVEVKHEPEPSGGTRTTIVIERQGTTWLREPVVVEVIDDDGHAVRATWDAPGPRGVVSVVTPAEFDEAMLDPDDRIAQDPALVDGHPEFDDDTSHTWKPPVFGAFSASYSTAEKQLYFDVSFALERRYDVDRSYGLQTFQNARGFGAALRYLGGFGRLRDLNGRIGTWGLGIGADRSPTGFGASPTPVSEVSLLASILWDTTRQLQDPMTGRSLLLSATGNLARKDGGGTSPNVILAARGRLLFWEHVRTTSVLVAGGGLVLGPALETQLLGLAGRQFLRAFEADEAIGKSRAYVIFEQRYRALTGVYLSGGPGTWFKGLELVPWIAAGAVSSNTNAFDFSGKGRFLAEVGIGTRLLHEWGGVQPATISIDLAYPIGRVDDCAKLEVSGTCARTRQKIGFWVGFEQTM